MRRLFLSLAVAAASLVLTGAGQQAPERRASFTDAQKADLDRISAYLNGIRTMKGSFTQLSGTGGLSRGWFWIQKPGKMRFEYWPPVPTVVVADGYSILVQNSKLHTTDRYPLGDSPLTFVLSNTLNLKFNPYVTGVEHANGSIIVYAKSAKNRLKGNIAMMFSEAGPELKQWTILDAQGAQTTVSLDAVQVGVPLPGSTFVLNDDSKLLGSKPE